MKNYFSKSLLLLLLGLGVTSVTANERISIADYAYEKRVIFSGTGEVGVALDQEALSGIDDRFANFDVLDGGNQNLDFEIFYQEPSLLKTTFVKSVSSSLRGEPAAITDRNELTTFLFDEKIDKRNPSWVLVDLMKPVMLNRVQILSPEQSRIRYVTIEAGDSPESLKVVSTKQPLSYNNDFTLERPVRYLKISFYGLRVELNEIRFYASSDATVYLDAHGARDVRFLYGGNQVDHIRYKKRHSAPKLVENAGTLSRQTWNKLFDKDVDGDGTENINDNCPFTRNKSQKDLDDDRVGDACDNAPHAKNINQSDVDKDGIGDIADNCKLKQNVDQKDKDKDGEGDACDNAHAKERNSLLAGKNYAIYLSLGIIGLILIGGGYFFYNKQKNDDIK